VLSMLSRTTANASAFNAAPAVDSVDTLLILHRNWSTINAAVYTFYNKFTRLLSGEFEFEIATEGRRVSRPEWLVTYTETVYPHADGHPSWY